MHCSSQSFAKLKLSLVSIQMSSCIHKHLTVQTPELSQGVQKKERKGSILWQNLSWRLFFVARWKKVTEKSLPWTFPGTQVFVTDRLTFTWKWNPTWGKPLVKSNSIWQRQNLHFRTRTIPNLTRCIIISNSSISIVCRVNILWLANDENRRPRRQNLGRGICCS